MNACQLCGAKSWGLINPLAFSVPRPEDYSTSRQFLLGKDLREYRCCDGCGAFAALAHLEPAPPPRVDPVADSLGLLMPGPANPLTMAQSMLEGILPKKQAETRLERLLRAALVAPISREPQALVNYVLACEDLLIAAEADDRTKKAFNPDRLCALEAFASRIESLTLNGGALSDKTSQAGFLVKDALDQLWKGGVDLDVTAAAKGTGGLYNPHGLGGGPWLVLSWKTKESFVDWLYLRLCSVDSPGPVDKLHSPEIRRLAEQVAEHVLDPGTRPS